MFRPSLCASRSSNLKNRNRKGGYTSILSLHHNVSRLKRKLISKHVGGLNFVRYQTTKFSLTKKLFSERFEDDKEDNSNLADVLVFVAITAECYLLILVRTSISIQQQPTVTSGRLPNLFTLRAPKAKSPNSQISFEIDDINLGLIISFFSPGWSWPACRPSTPFSFGTLGLCAS